MEIDKHPMGSRSPRSDDQFLPDLPIELTDFYEDDDVREDVRDEVIHEIPARRDRPRLRGTSRTRRLPQDEVVAIAQPGEDIVVGRMVSEEARPARRPRSAPLVVLPPWRDMVSQAIPSLVMAATALIAIASGTISLLGVPVWAFAMVIPGLALLLLTNHATHPLWMRATIVNMLTLFAVFPLLVVRQSVSRIPFMRADNGTLLAPTLTTLLLIAVLTGIAIASAVLSVEDPEYAGVIFLPTAMLVPFFAGATTITSLRTAMAMLAIVYVATAGLTVVASFTPTRYVDVIAPATIMIEFLILAAVRGSDVFPIGAGAISKALFFTVIAYTVAMTIAVPLMAQIARQVVTLVQMSFLKADVVISEQRIAG